MEQITAPLLQSPASRSPFFPPLFCAIVGSSPHPFCCIVSLAMLWVFAAGSVREGQWLQGRGRSLPLGGSAAGRGR